MFERFNAWMKAFNVQKNNVYIAIIVYSSKKFYVPLSIGWLILFIMYQYNYSTYVDVPGNNQITPLGWWGWFDQGQYIKGAKALFRGDFSPSQHFYPPLYPFILSLFLNISENNPDYAPDLALLIGYFVVYMHFFRRYIGSWGGLACALVGMVLYGVLRAQWVVPWTTTPGAFLIISTLFLLDRYIRHRSDSNWTWQDSAANAFGFGLAVGLQGALRPVDLLIMAPIALTYATLVIAGAVLRRGEARKLQIAAIPSGAIGFALPFSAFLLFNYVTYGSILGGYVGAISVSAFDYSMLPMKLFSLFLASQVFFGEQNADWWSQIPLIFVAVTVLPVALFSKHLIFRVMAVAGILQIVVYSAYIDLLPNGMFRYFNIHYFKWLAPVAVGIAFYTARSAFIGDPSERRQGRVALAASIALVLGTTSITAARRLQSVSGVEQRGQEISFELPGGAADYVDVGRVGGAWVDVYFSNQSSVTLDDTRRLTPFADYRFIPMADGVRLLFLHRVQAGKVDVRLASNMTLGGELSAGDIKPVTVRFRFRFPLGQQSLPVQ